MPFPRQFNTGGASLQSLMPAVGCALLASAALLAYVTPVQAEGRRAYDLFFRATIPSLCAIHGAAPRGLVSGLTDAGGPYGPTALSSHVRVICNIPYAIEARHTYRRLQRGRLIPTADAGPLDVDIKLTTDTTNGALQTSCTGEALRESGAPCILAGSGHDLLPLMARANARFEFERHSTAANDATEALALPASLRREHSALGADQVTVSILPRW